MKVRIPILLLSTASGIFIFTILSFFIVWLGFPTNNPEDTFKDALDFSGGIFAGATTFGAAIVAGFLFNDWRDEKEYELTKESSFSLLKATLNINSTLENYLAITNEFKKIHDDDEYNEYCKWCDDFARDFMHNLIAIKTENNLHHGLVLNYEKDKKLFSFDDLSLMNEIFNQLSENACTNAENYKNSTNNETIQINVSKYSAMIDPKIKFLNEKCKPPK